MNRVECNCQSMCIVGEESVLHGHHVNCDLNTEKLEMARLKFDGAWCIMEIEDALEQLREIENDDVFKFQKVWMTQNELALLPEFTGW